MASTKSKQDVLIDELLKECPDPKDILGKNGLLKQLDQAAGRTNPASRADGSSGLRASRTGRSWLRQ